MEKLKEYLHSFYLACTTLHCEETLERIDNMLDIIDGVDEDNAVECRIAMRKLKKIMEETY